MQRSSPFNRPLRIILSTLIALGLGLLGLIDAGYNLDARSAPAVVNGAVQYSNLDVLTLLFAVGVSIYAGLQVRMHPRRSLWAVLLFAGVTQMGLPVLCIVGAALLARCREKADALWLSLAAAVAVGLVALDGLRPDIPSALASVLSSETEPTEVSTATSFTVGLLVIIVAAAMGYTARAAGNAKRSRSQAARATEKVGGLQQQVAKQQEHEMLAREVHDGLASKLSMLSLQQVELRMLLKKVVDDPAAQQALSDMLERSSETIGTAHKDLSDLIGLLREPGALAERLQQAVEGQPDHISGLTRLIAQLDRTGTRVSSNIAVTDSEHMPHKLQAGIYRIVQETITNCAKHAPGRPVSVLVTADPTHGAHLRIANDIAPHAEYSTVPSGRGLTGIRERVTKLRGTCTMGLDLHGQFVVEVNLPWSHSTPAPQDSA